MRKAFLVLCILVQCGCSYVAPTLQCAVFAVSNPVQAPTFCKAFFTDVEETEEKRWCNAQEIWPEKCWKYR